MSNIFFGINFCLFSFSSLSHILLYSFFHLFWFTICSAEIATTKYHHLTFYYYYCCCCWCCRSHCCCFCLTFSFLSFSFFHFFSTHQNNTTKTNTQKMKNNFNEIILFYTIFSHLIPLTRRILLFVLVVTSHYCCCRLQFFHKVVRMNFLYLNLFAIFIKFFSILIPFFLFISMKKNCFNCALNHLISDLEIKEEK